MPENTKGVGGRIMPFLWVHGESEAMYRHMVQVIHDASLDAFCVEARPHPQFCQEQWWRDLSIIIDEAEKLGMKVWLLDDKHFPTGYAAGAVKNAPLALRRRHIIHRSISVSAGTAVRLDVKRYVQPKEKQSPMDVVMLLYANHGLPRKIRQDELLSVTAYSRDQHIDLARHIHNGKLCWTVPEGDWHIDICALTYDSGTHREYINMLDEASCRLQIEAVYAPHYAHFSGKFGTVIAGFFSDEPELGNGSYTRHGNTLGTEQSLPYSKALAARLEKALGAEWKNLLPLLWRNEYNRSETARVRFIYMDCVTRLVEECFSMQIGQWCRARCGVHWTRDRG